MKHLLVFGVAFATFYICHSEMPEFCRLPTDEGTGSNLYILIYYDAVKDSCYPFRYYGEGGNENRFTNDRDCMRNCSARSEEVYPVDVSRACLLPMKHGECLGQHLRFYYDAVHDKCKKFMWTGCVGNGNRFLDHTSCNSTCDGIHDDDRDTVEEDEPDTPVALICGIVFGVVGAIIIIVVVVLSAQSGGGSKKRSKKTKEPQTELPLQETPTDIPLA